MEQKKKFTQFGTFTVVALLPILLITIGMMVYDYSHHRPSAYAYLIPSFILLLCLLTFYRLTITISPQQVSFKLGIGLFGKRYKMEDIKSCEPVTNAVFNGIGIHILSNGWLYNVSGLKAIELRFKNGSSMVRIGTNKQGKISQLIQSYLK